MTQWLSFAVGIAPTWETCNRPGPEGPEYLRLFRGLKPPAPSENFDLQRED
jgi:hypothetical protein